VLTIPFTLTRRDVCAVYRRLFARGKSHWTIMAFGAAIALYGAAIAEPVFVVFGAAYVSVWAAFLLLVVPGIAWHRYQQSGPSQVVTVSDKGISMTLSHASSTTDWSVWMPVGVLADVYVIRARHRGYCLVPRRAFASAHDEQSFRALVANGTGTPVP
jgi:hypothetical protein